MAMIVVIVGVYVLFELSEPLSFQSVGADYHNSIRIASGYGASDRPYRVYKTSINGKNALLQIVQNGTGIWVVSQITYEHQVDGVFIGWNVPLGVGVYETDKLSTGFEWHKVYYNNDAIDLVYFEGRQLPGGVAVDVIQQDKEYCIHFVTYGEVEAFSQIDIHSILLENGCIADEI